MAYCKNFINGINAINFSDESALLLRNSLIAFAYQQLKKEYDLIQEELLKLSMLPELPENEFANTQLKLYKEKQEKTVTQIENQLKTFALLYGVDIVEAKSVIEDSALFVKAFAENFRDVNHLAYTLSDAPLAIKKLQTPLYIEVLLKLTPEQQEAQLQTLLLPNIKDMVEQAIEMYDSNPQNSALQNQCKKIVQMGLYEIVRRDCNTIDVVAEAPQYKKYQEFIAALHSKLPLVGKSSIIDGLSNYKASNGKSIGDLLAKVEDNFKITKTGDWKSDDKINALKARKALLDSLRFGQEDRREYAKKTESNLVRDLFWARTINEVELFTKSKVVDKTYASLGEQRYLQQKERPFQEKLKGYTDEEPKYRKLQEILERMYDRENRKEEDIPIGREVFAKRESDIKGYIRKTLVEELAQPLVTVLSNGEIEVNFYFFEMDEVFIERLSKIIKDQGGFGWTVPSIMKAFTGDSVITDKLHSTALRGKSFSDIATQLLELERSRGITTEQAKAYKAEFNNLKKTVNLAQYSQLSQVKPDNSNSNSLLLSTLHELQALYAIKNVKEALNAPTSLSFENALKEINTLALSKSKGSHELLLEKIRQFQLIYTNKIVDAIPTPRVALDEIRRLAAGKKNDALLLRIQELKDIYAGKPVDAPTTSILETAFRHLEAGRLEDALRTPGLLTSLNDVSQRLSRLEPEISFLKLDNNEELLLRKLLELQSISKDRSVVDTLEAPTLLNLENSLAELKQLALSKEDNSHELLLKKIKDLQAQYADKIVKDTEPTPKAAFEELNQLALAKNNEALVRRIEALQVVYVNKKVFAPTASILKVAFDHLVAGRYKEALETPGLEASFTDAYTRLAGLDPDLAAEPVKSVIEKSKVMVSSAQQRLKRSAELKEAFESGVDVTKKVEAIFLAEYHAMESVLKLNAKELERMDSEIKNMAEDMVRLIERTRAGQPAISDDEQAAYFSILQQIAKDIDQDISDVQFKVKHSTTGKQTINVLDAEGKLIKEVEIDLGKVKLPYSLIKPPGGDFIFSYGGSRGIIAPFEGLDKAYVGTGGKKGRLFTHSRLLGVGQYGSVKEVESLLSGLNQVIKQGYAPSTDGTPTFKDESRNELRTRPITARNDPLYLIERDVNRYLSKVEQAQKGSLSGETQSWTKKDKAREEDILFSKSGTPEKYQILTERAKGETLADSANKKLNLFAKQDIAYHDPSKRDPEIEGELISSLTDTLNLSQAIVSKAQEFQKLHFSHNDIKPENFLYIKNSDGSYQVKYIDWATGGFEQSYKGTAITAVEIFSEVFDGVRPTVIKENECRDDQGRFVRLGESEKEKTFGVDPTLQILHGARNGTLPYISPKVLEGGSRAPKDGSIPDPKLNTVLKTDESYMDDWALTAMTFGVCNREAYFTLVKGRAVTDYVIPGVLDVDGGKPLGLKITSRENFNKYFACGTDLVTEEDLQTGDAYTKKDAVMFIPSNQREGEPLHLYRRLQMVQEKLQATEAAKLPDSAEQQIIKDIQAILTEVHKVVASGEGFTKTQLQEQLTAAQRCIKNYEKLNDSEYKKTLLEGDTLQTVFNENEKKKFTADSLLMFEGKLRRIEVLTTYPRNEQQREKAIAILEEAINEIQLNDKFIGKGKPCRHLFRECIKQGQGEILNSLFAKITSTNNTFIDLVEEQGLLHYAAEQGMTDVFSNLVKTLRTAGASDNQIFELMLKEYGPGEKHLHTAPQVRWATNCLHIAIRNNNKDQLAVILDFLPANAASFDNVVKSALHQCAALGNKALFEQIISKYNEKNVLFRHINPKTIIRMYHPPDDTSPYHLFLNDKANLNAIPWAELQKVSSATMAKDFLLVAPPGTHAYPVLIAARNENYAGVANLLDIATTAQLSSVGWDELFGQTDEYGKNLFNYVLEQGQFSVLTDLLASIKKNCAEPQKVLVNLLSNPHPVNPLRNFLKSEKNETLQFAILNQVFDEISSDLKSEEAQKARIVALLVNEAWLIEKANNPKSHDSLRELFKLSIPLKQSLFAKLVKDAEELSLAKTFYSELLAEVSPHHEAEMAQPVALEIPVIVMQEVAKQSSDLNVLISALVSGRDVIKDLSEQIIGLKEESVRIVEDHKKELERQKDIAEGALHKATLQFTTRIEELSKSLSEKTSALEQGVEDKEKLTSEIRQVKDELELLKKSSRGRISELEQDVQQKAKEYKEELERQKQLARKLEVLIQSKDEELQKKHEQLEKLTETLKLVAQQKAVLALEKLIANSGIEQVKAIAGAENPEELLRLGLDKVDVEVLKDAPLLFKQAIKGAKDRLFILENPQRKEDVVELSPEVLRKLPSQTTKKKPLDLESLGEDIEEESINRSGSLEVRKKSRGKDELDEEDEFFEDEESFEDVERRRPQLFSGRVSLKPVSGSANQEQREAFDALVAEIDQSKDYELLQLIRRAHTKEGLFAKTDFGRLNSKKVHALLEHPDEIGKLVERARIRLDRLNELRHGERNKVLTGRTQWEALERYNRKVLQAPMQNIMPLKEIRNELKGLNLSSLTWLNPVFQASAKPDALELEPHFKELAEASDVIVPYLYRQRCVIKEFLGGLPTDSELDETPYKEEVLAHKKVLIRYLQKIEAELRIQMPIQKMLKGNEDKKNRLDQQGMLQTIKQAKEELTDIRQLSTIFKVSYTDYPLTEKNNHLDSSGKVGLGASLEVYEPDNVHPYQMVDRVQAGHFREHTVSINNQVVGRFIEERVDGIDKIGVKPKVKLTVTSFPPATDVDGRVAYSVAIVTQLLAGLKEPPSAKNPIILRGENTEELEYLWTTLRLIGDKSPHMKFGPEAIKVTSIQHFNPDKEMGQGTEKFSANSCYKNNFERCPQLNQLMTDVVKLTSDKFGHKEEHQKVYSHSGHAVTLYKGKMKEALEEMRQDNINETGPQFK